MATSTTLFDWQDGSLIATDSCEVAEVALEVADSFLVSQGTVLAVGLHRERFADSVRLRGHADRSQLEDFWAAAIAAIPREGDWFPRFELVTVRDTLRLRFRLRSAPERGESIVVATAASDPRRTPHIKGPDIVALGRLRQAAQHRGAQEAVILDAGRVSDGATTAILWWRGDTLFTPPLSLPRVDSVSARTVRGVAAAVGMPVDEESLTPEQLEGCTVWAVNALHGIRAVTSWVDGPPLGQDPKRSAAWRARLAALARPL